MKIPKYMKAEIQSGKMYVHIKRWGLPIILFKALRNGINTKWWVWLIYPYLCIELMCKS